MYLFALTVITAGLGIYYRDSCTVPYGCLGQSGLLLYVRCGQPLCGVNHTAVDLRQCRDNTGPVNGTDTWLDDGCEFLGGGCTRRFTSADGDQPWCVPVALDEEGAYAPSVRIGTTKCRVECDQDYGILDASGNMTCACPSPLPPFYNACDLNYTELDPDKLEGCFCRSPTPCNLTDCPCVTKQGVIARALDGATGRLDLRELYPFDDLFLVAPCLAHGSDTSNQCPVDWKKQKSDERSQSAMTQGYRFYRSSARVFYQPTGLNPAALVPNSCICIEHCFGEFPIILCLMPTWEKRRFVKCLPAFRLSEKSDLRHKAIPVQGEDKNNGKIKALNGTDWICE